MAAELSRLKKSRTANKNVLKGLIVKAQNAMKDGPGAGTTDDVTAFLKTIRKKITVIEALNGQILAVIAEENIEEDIEESTNFDTKIEKDVAAIEKAISPVVEKNEVTNHGSTFNKTGVKLPKIIIKKFSGDPVSWRQFEETFEATVDKNTNLSDIEKFSYLKGYFDKQKLPGGVNPTQREIW